MSDKGQRTSKTKRSRRRKRKKKMGEGRVMVK